MQHSSDLCAVIKTQALDSTCRVTTNHDFKSSDPNSRRYSEAQLTKTYTLLVLSNLTRAAGIVCVVWVRLNEAVRNINASLNNTKPCRHGFYNPSTLTQTQSQTAFCFHIKTVLEHVQHQLK